MTVGDDIMKHIYTSIDFGSDSIKIVVAELFQNKINLLASVSHKSKGIKKGLVVDFDAALEATKSAISEIEEILGLKIKKVIANISSFNAEYSVIKGNIKLSEGNSVVTSENVMAVLEAALRTIQFSTREMILFYQLIIR